MKIVSLVGHAKRAPKVTYKAVELQITNLNNLWLEVHQITNPKLLRIHLFLPGYKFMFETFN